MIQVNDLKRRAKNWLGWRDSTNTEDESYNIIQDILNLPDSSLTSNPWREMKDAPRTGETVQLGTYGCNDIRLGHYLSGRWYTFKGDSIVVQQLPIDEKYLVWRKIPKDNPPPSMPRAPDCPDANGWYVVEDYMPDDGLRILVMDKQNYICIARVNKDTFLDLNCNKLQPIYWKRLPSGPITKNSKLV